MSAGSKDRETAACHAWLRNGSQSGRGSASRPGDLKSHSGASKERLTLAPASLPDGSLEGVEGTACWARPRPTVAQDALPPGANQLAKGGDTCTLFSPATDLGTQAAPPAEGSCVFQLTALTRMPSVKMKAT